MPATAIFTNTSPWWGASSVICSICQSSPIPRNTAPWHVFPLVIHEASHHRTRCGCVWRNRFRSVHHRRPPEPRVHSLREDRAQALTRGVHSAGGDQIVVQLEYFGRPQRPRIVFVGHPPRPAGFAGVSTPTRGEPDLEGRGSHVIADADAQHAAQTAAGPAPHALVGDDVPATG